MNYESLVSFNIASEGTYMQRSLRHEKKTITTIEWNKFIDGLEDLKDTQWFLINVTTFKTCQKK